MTAKFRSFTEAREFVRSLGLKSETEWRAWSKHSRPPDIPAGPARVYRGSWQGFGDWLGTQRPASRDIAFRPFDEAREFVRSLGLKTQAEWGEWSKGSRPPDIPSAPNETYRDSGWRGFGDWLGTFRTAPQDTRFRPFDEARAFARALGLKTRDEWREWCKTDVRPPDIPQDPEAVYSDSGWRGLRDWMGTEHLGRFPMAVPGTWEFKMMMCNLASWNSQTTHARFRADPAKWWRFHELFGKSRRRWAEKTIENVAALIRKEISSAGATPPLADLGCGQCLLRDALPEYEITGVDHVAYDSGVISCDMARTPLEDSSFDAAVFCLSLLGRNWPDYLHEAWRILRPGGRLFIVESLPRWERMELETTLEKQRFTEIHVEKHPRERGCSRAFVYARATRPKVEKVEPQSNEGRSAAWKR